MHPPFPYRFKNQQLWLSPDRLVYWEDKKAMVLSDLHFGKTGHFRKSGIAVPQSVFKEDLHRLVGQIQYFQPAQLIIAGDLFHSRENKELELFKKWRENFPNLSIQLVKGNHDILHEEWYKACGIELHAVTMNIENFSFVHDMEDLNGSSEAAGNYYFSGHIHPGIRINGAGKQSLCFHCFYFGKAYAILPAFSRFTGVALVEPKRQEEVFAIVEHMILQIQ